MSLLQETCGAITGRNQEIEQHIIDSWNAASSVEQYGGPIWLCYESRDFDNTKAVYDYC